MELGLRLGDGPSSGPVRCLQNSNRPVKELGLSFCMALGGAGVDSDVNQELEKAQKFHEVYDDGEEEDKTSEGDNGGSDDNRGETSLRLSLLPLSAISRRISSPWSFSDNGSSENDSCGNKGGTLAARGLRVGSLPAAVMAEEVSSANSDGPPFRMGFASMYRNGGTGSLAVVGNNKRDFDAAGDAAAAAVETERESFRGSDDEDDRIGLNTRKKLRLSKDQSAFLEENFKEHTTLNPKQKLALANQLNLRPRQVEVWFQNRRARTKLKQTEVDCEYMKRCCETLSEENKRLQKELQDLRALKASSNGLHLQLPATTLTMCPSCERAPHPANYSTAMISAAAGGKMITADSSPKAVPFPLSRPRFYPFSQAPKQPNQPQSS